MLKKIAATALITTGIIAMSGCATGFRAGAPGAVNVIAHRGASAYAPENTLRAFSLAADMGADWFELDCTLTQDEEVIVIHDDNTKRTAGKEKRVAAQTLAELKQLDAGAWKDPAFAGERLPTLAEALDLAKARQVGVYIEIKNSDDDMAIINDAIQRAGDVPVFSPAMKRQLIKDLEKAQSRNLTLTRKVIQLVRERRMQRQIVIQSFSPTVCAAALIEAPRLRTELLAAKDKDNPGRWPMYLRWAELIQPHGFNTNGECLQPDLLAAMHQANRTVAIWTVDEDPDMQRYAQWGVDAIITNKPDRCLAVLKAMGKR